MIGGVPRESERVKSIGGEQFAFPVSGVLGAGDAAVNTRVKPPRGALILAGV